MNTMKICSGCQKPLEPDAADGLCPECLLKAGLGTGVNMGPAPPVYDVTAVPPLEGAGATRTARWPWVVSIAAVVLLIPMGLITGWLLSRDAGTAGPQVSPEQPTFRQGTFDEVLWNPGFEAGLEPWGWPGGWWTISTTTDNPHSGRQAAIVSKRTDPWQGIGQSLLGRIEPGRVYDCSAWVRIENAPEAVVTLHVTKIDDSNNGAMSDRFLGSRKVVENEWTEIHGTYVLDDLTGSLGRLFFYLGGPPPGVNLVVDDVCIAPAQTAEAWTWNRIAPLALMFGLCGILLSAIVAALLQAWLAARSRRVEPSGGGAMDQPPTGAEAPPKRGSRLEKLLWFGSVSLLLTVILVVWQAWPRRMPQSAKTAETIPTIPPEVPGGVSSRWTRNAPRFIPPTVLREVRWGRSRDSQTGTKPPLQQADTNGVFVLKAIEAEIHGQIARYEELKDCIGFWMVREDYVSWACDVMKPGRFGVAITYACAPGVEGSQYTVSVEAPAVDSEPSEAPGSKITDTVKATGGWASYIMEAPGEIELSPGRYKIAVRALTVQSAVMNLREVKLSPLP
jgi:hypothetical protein